MKRLIAGVALLLPLVLVGCSVNLGTNGISMNDCRYDRAHSQEVAVDGAKSLRLDGWSGSLTIRGKEGATAVRAEGKACSSDAKVLDQIGLKAEKSGDTVNVEVLHPAKAFVGSAYMDLTIELPANMVAWVDKSSGSVLIESVAGLELTKASGEAEVRQIKGDLRVKTASGSVKLSDVEGATTYEGASGDLTMQGLKSKVTILDKASGTVTAKQLGSDLVLESVSSGDMDLREIKGSVTLHKKASGTVQVSGVGGSFTAGTIGSGTLEVRQVTGEVAIQQKSSGTVTIAGVGKGVLLAELGSGTLRVEDVKGDLTVKSKSSGSVTYDKVQGKVDVPKQ